MTTLNSYAAQIHATAKSHGFWDKERNFGEMLALMHSELSEALEEHREGRPPIWFKATKVVPVSTDPYSMTLLWDEKKGLCYETGGVISTEHRDQIDNEEWLLKPEGWATEIVDAIIRELDTLGEAGIDIDWLVRIKASYNDQRAHMHGKSY